MFSLHDFRQMFRMSLSGPEVCAALFANNIHWPLISPARRANCMSNLLRLYRQPAWDGARPVLAASRAYSDQI